jgi:glycosyltransferase involved in cell wall biosynthesis
MILLATYNGEKYLRDLLDSIFAQKYTYWTILVSDDGSTDSTLEILKEYQKNHPSKIFILENDSPSGSASGNFIRLMRQCSAAYMMFCDQDDVWEPCKVEITLECLLKIENIKEKRPALVFTDLAVVDGTLRPIASSFIRYSKLNASRTGLHQLLVQNIITGCTVMINKPLRDMALKVQNREKVMMHDWWLALVASAFGDIGYIDRATIKYRQHGDNEVGAKNPRNVSYLLNRLLKKDAMKQSLKDTTVQAGELAVVLGDRMPKKTRTMVNGYAQLYQKGKLARLAFIIKYRIFKYGAMRKLAQILWS